MPEIWLMIEWKLALLAFVIAAAVRRWPSGSSSTSGVSAPTGSHSQSSPADPVATYKPFALTGADLLLHLKLGFLTTLAGILVALLLTEA